MDLTVLAEISRIVNQIETGQLTSARVHEVISTLTPDQREIWEEVAPWILNSDLAMFDEILGGWHW